MLIVLGIHNLDFISFVSLFCSLQEVFLVHSHCCPTPWTLHGNKVTDVEGAFRNSFTGLFPLLLVYFSVILCNIFLSVLSLGHPNMGGPMQRMNPPRGMGPMGPGPQVKTWADHFVPCPVPSVMHATL